MSRDRWIALVGALGVLVVAAVVVVLGAQGRRAADLADREAAALAELEAMADGAATDVPDSLPMADDSGAAGDDPEAAGDAPDDAADGPAASPGTSGGSDAAAITADDRPSSPGGTGVDDGSPGSVLLPGDLVFLGRVPGDDYGRLTVLRDGERIELDPACDRMHASGGLVVCTTADGGLVPSWTTRLLAVGPTGLDEIRTSASALPSRARVAPDGSAVATTAFVTGHSYLQVGEFATETAFLDDDPTSARRLAEQLTVDGDPRYFGAVDSNWWGATFVPGTTEVYLTHGGGGRTDVVLADLATMTAAPTGFTGTCPSISPDGTHLAFKRRIPGSDVPRLMVRDLRSGEEWLLGETRFVDDQVEWLDDDTLVYAMPRDDAPIQPTADVWSLDIAEGAEPELLVPYAFSPAVYRDTTNG